MSIVYSSSDFVSATINRIRVGSPVFVFCKSHDLLESGVFLGVEDGHYVISFPDGTCLPDVPSNFKVVCRRCYLFGRK